MPTITIINNASITVISPNNEPVYMDVPVSEGIYADITDNTVSLSTAYTPEGISAVFNSNYNDICNHTPESEYGKDGYYISKLGGVSPIDNNTFIVGGNTTDILPYSSHGIVIDDFGRPDIDCDDYCILNNMLAKIEAYLDTVKRQIIGIPSGSTTADIYGAHQQYQACIKLWNYLVQILTLRMNASYQNKHIFLQASFVNNTPYVVTQNNAQLDVLFDDCTCEPYPFIKFIRAYADSTDGTVELTPLNIGSTFIPLNSSTFSWGVDGTFNSGAVTTLQFQFELSAVENKKDLIQQTYELDPTLNEFRVRVTPGIELVPASQKASWIEEHIHDFKYFYDIPPEIADGISMSMISNGSFTIAPRDSEPYTEDDAGSYLITMSGGATPECGITKDGILCNNIVKITDASGFFTAGDKFTFMIKAVPVESSSKKIQDCNINANITWGDLPLSQADVGTLTRSKNVHITAEDETVGKLEATMYPQVNVMGFGVNGPALESHDIQIGTVSIGTVSIGSIDMGTVSIGSVDIGSIDIGTVSIGTVSIGSVSIGSIIPPEVIVNEVEVVGPNIKGPKINVNTVTVDVEVRETKR